MGQRQLDDQRAYVRDRNRQRIEAEQAEARQARDARIAAHDKRN